MLDEMPRHHPLLAVPFSWACSSYQPPHDGARWLRRHNPAQAFMSARSPAGRTDPSGETLLRPCRESPVPAQPQPRPAHVTADLSLGPVATATSRTVLPSARKTATRLSIGMRPSVAATRSGAMRVSRSESTTSMGRSSMADRRPRPRSPVAHPSGEHLHRPAPAPRALVRVFAGMNHPAAPLLLSRGDWNTLTKWAHSATGELVS